MEAELNAEAQEDQAAVVAGLQNTSHNRPRHNSHKICKLRRQFMLLVGFIQEMRDAAIHSLDRVETGLDAEAREDEAARQHYGDEQWPLQPASIVAANLRDRLAGYRWAPIADSIINKRTVQC